MKLNTVLLAAATTGILIGISACGGDKPPVAADGTSAMPAAKNQCKAGKNSCSGKGGCKTADHGCNGQNSCSGKGGDSSPPQ